MPLIRFLQNMTVTTVWTSVAGVWPQLNDVVYNPTLNLWTVVGNTKKILTSPDGTAWTSRTAGAGIESSLGRVQIGEGDTLFASRSSNVVDYSTDGITWTRKDLAQVDAPCQALGLAYSPTLDLWLAVGQANKELSYSSDGTTTPWSNIGAFTGLLSASEILWDTTNSLFVAAGSNNMMVQTSPDGFTWTQATDMDTYGIAEGGYSIAWDGDQTYLMSITGGGVTRIWRNSSGNPTSGSWRDVTHCFGSARINSIAYSPAQDKWKACSDGSAQIGTSTDGGVTWTLDPVVPSSVNLFGINWSEELLQWVCVGQGPISTGLIFTSPT